MQGYTSTSQGAKIASAVDQDLIATASRIMGAKPMEEAILLSSMYRTNAYKEMDKAKIEKLGAIIKARLRDNQMPTDEEFSGFFSSYIKNGGRAETYSSAIQRWTRDSSMELVQRLRNKHSDPYSKRMLELAGATYDDDSTAPETSLPELK
jgi:hypothetical protein